MADETVVHQPNLAVRNGTFYLRARVPLELVEALGRTHVVVSLRTKERRAALIRFRLEQARIEREFEAARLQAREAATIRTALASGRLEKLAPGEIEALALRWFEHAVQRVSPTSEDAGDLRLTDWDAVLEELKADEDRLRSPNPEHWEPIVDVVLDRVLLSAGIPPETYGRSKIKRMALRPKVDRTTAQYGQLATLVRRGLIVLNRKKLSRLEGSASTGPDLLQPADVLNVKPRRSLDEMISAFASDPGRGSRTGKTEADYAMVFLALREVIGGETDVHRISREQARRLRDLFRTLPPNATKRFPGKSLQQAAEIATAKGLPTLNAQTINSHLTKAATLFNWGVREEWIGKNPATGLAIEEARTSRREPFSLPQLQAIFSAPIFTGCQNDAEGYARPGPNQPRRARFWVPLLSLFHGLRLNECCQLRPQDIAERDGIPAILVRAADADQRVKSKAGTRVVPIHPEVIAIGFLEFVDAAQRAGNQRLFSELSQDARGYFSDAFQKWFTRFLRSCGAAREGTTFHSFRHGWADRMREAGVPEDRRYALGGWTATSVGARYGHGFPTKMLAEDIARISYPGLSLKQLGKYRATG